MRAGHERQMSQLHAQDVTTGHSLTVSGMGSVQTLSTLPLSCVSSGLHGIVHLAEGQKKGTVL